MRPRHRRRQSENRQAPPTRQRRSGPPQGDAAPGPPPARRTGHAVVEFPARQPHAERDLEDQEVEDADVRRLAAALTLDREDAVLGQRVVGGGDATVPFGACAGIPRPLAHREDGRTGARRGIVAAGWHPEQRTLAQRIGCPRGARPRFVTGRLRHSAWRRRPSPTASGKPRHRATRARVARPTRRGPAPRRSARTWAPPARTPEGRTGRRPRRAPDASGSCARRTWWG